MKAVDWRKISITLIERCRTCLVDLTVPSGRRLSEARCSESMVYHTTRGETDKKSRPRTSGSLIGFVSGATMRHERHIQRDDLMNPDPLSQIVIIVGLLGIVILLIILIHSL